MESKKSFWEAAGLDGAFLIGGEMLKEVFKEHGPKVLKSLIGGLGTNDEALYLSAVSYAVVRKNVDVSDIEKIENVINAHPEIRARVVEIVGKDEQPVTIEVLMEDKNGQPVMDKKTGLQKTTKSTINMNVRGGEAIFVMSKMTPDQILNHLRTAGGFATVGHNLQNIATGAANLGRNIANSQAAQNINGVRNRINNWFATH